ncbi:unnamed protein product [Clavelina lepadiformis]|uniref:Hydantoinase B/oxoprolinase domain-containing protein n=1 Tax=Clavelina lepadiformis TaxID=159417 RepID=A0ABP0G9D3_CLALP
MTSFEDQPSIGYNMGVTSTDLSRYDREYEHVFKSTTAGVTIQAPQRICQVIHGPAIIIDKISTILVEPDCKGKMTKKGDVTIMIGKGKPKHIGKELDAIQLSIFSHRFMSIAEQMGRILQRTAISTNIMERLDFSCALFGHDGGLVSNASHILGHLGAMQNAVQYQIRAIDINEGDCILSNHPCTGGVHLPNQSREYDHSSVCKHYQIRVFPESIKTDLYLNPRYERTDCALMCQPSTVKNLDFVASKFGDFLQTFQARYKKEFGFASPGRDIINDGGRVGGIELSGIEDHALVTSSGKPPHVEKLNSFFISSSRILDIRSYQISSINNATF